MQRRLKFIIPLVIALLAIGYLFSSAFDSALQYYVTVAELQAGTQSTERTLKVGGRVQMGSLKQTGTGPVRYAFRIEQGEQSVPVIYTGLVPDTFREGGEVVATGRVGAEGTFHATHLLAKCASKYQTTPEHAGKNIQYNK